MRYLFYPGWAVSPEYYRRLDLTGNEAPEVFDYGFFCPGMVFEQRRILNAVSGGRTVIFGHSLGSMFALRAAAGNPDIAGLVLFSPFARFSEDLNYPGQPLRNIKAMRMQLRRDAKGLLENFYSAMSDPEIFALSCDLSFNVAALDEGLRFLMEYDVRDLLPEVRCPVLVIHGGMDNISGHGQTEYLTERLPSVKRKMITDAGHSVLFTRTDECRGAVQAFLNGIIK